MDLKSDTTAVSAPLRLHAEQITVARRRVEGDTVRVSTVTREIEKIVDETLMHERVEVKHVAIGLPIDAVPPVHKEEDVTIIPIVEEILVVEKRLILKEEVHIRRVPVLATHHEVISLREQDIVVERTKPGETPRSLLEHAPIPRHQTLEEQPPMTDETIVAVYDSAERAALAVRDLEGVGVPSAAITQHAKGGFKTGFSSSSTAPVREEGFWASLFGSGPEHGHDTSVYDRSVDEGSTVVTVKAPEQHQTQVMDILERHNPVDIDERAATYGASQTTTTRATDAPVATGAVAARGSDDGTIQLSEETLAVGKRAINRGTTRVRRFVVETPIEEQVSLRDETVTIERRPVTDLRPATNADFTDKVMEMTETDEEAVVSKTARVREEVVIHKDATERTETVRDAVRREDVEITKEPGAERSTSTGSGIPVTPASKV